MHCSDFEDQLTDYLEGALNPETSQLVAAHALRCPICHETLSSVKSTLEACHAGSVPPPTKELEARILQRTRPDTVMNCENFEEFLTDYLDGFLPAHLYHRWERHAALCDRCTELPGDVVRAIGACYTYISEEKTVPEGLNQRILQATLGSVRPEEVRAPWTSRAASWLRLWLDPIVSPQFATVATMLLVAVFVLTNTVSADGSISGMYHASLQLAEQTTDTSNGEMKQITEGLKELVERQNQSTDAAPPKQSADQQKNQTQPAGDHNNGKNER
ncbi:MAG: anti-sigma factor [Pyrinomonadaceae bacterium]